MLSNTELTELANFYNIPLKSISLKDQLPYPARQGNYIINLASYKRNSSVQGTHWVCLILAENTFYCDPFGAPAPKEVMTYIKSFSPKHYAYNQTIIQDLKTETCGYYALGLMLFLKANPSKDFYANCKRYVDMFDDDTRRNEDILKSIFRLYSNGQPHPLIKRLYRE
jgi:hypothetical protein